MPGSPPTSTTDPGTMPPPRTKSNSRSPVCHRSTPGPPPRADRRTGGLPDRELSRLSARPPVRPTASSTSVFHAPQESQRPAHFGCSAPQSVQRNTECALATARLGGRLARREVVEPRVFLFEKQLHGASRPVALLSDDQLRQTLEALVGLGVGGAVVELLTVDEADHIGVLLD